MTIRVGIFLIFTLGVGLTIDPITRYFGIGILVGLFGWILGTLIEDYIDMRKRLKKEFK